MARNQSRRINPDLIQADRESFAALQTITAYRPANPALSLANLTVVQSAMNDAQMAETQAAVAYATARDEATAAEWRFHDAIVGARDQVMAQFGRDSNEAQAVGRKKASEFRSRTRRTPPPPEGQSPTA